MYHIHVFCNEGSRIQIMCISCKTYTKKKKKKKKKNLQVYYLFIYKKKKAYVLRVKSIKHKL